MADRKMAHIAMQSHCPGCTCSSPSPTNHSTGSLQGRIEMLQQEITEKNKVLAGYRRELNAQLPIARIPPEILSNVFLQHQDDGPSPREYIDKISWISVLHVSFHWRSVALSDARLWSSPNLRFPLLVEYFSHLFASIPLHVVLSPCKDQDSMGLNSSLTEIAAEIVCQAETPITTLQLRGTLYEMDEIATPILECTNDQLAVLELGPQSSDGGPYEIVGLESASLPNLRVLSLEHVVFLLRCDMIQSCSSSLRELTLNRCRFSGPRELLALSSLVSLERLSVIVCFEGILKKRNTPTVLIPTLSSLHICEPDPECVLLLARIQRPSGCSTSVRLYKEISTSLEDVWIPPEDIVQHIRASKPYRACLRFGTDTLIIECDTTNGKHTLELSVWNQLVAFVHAVLAAGPTTLRMAWAPDGHPLTGKGLIQVCAEAKTVRVLEIEGAHARLDALAECIYMREEFLPALAALHIEDADFTRHEEADQLWRDGVAARRAILKDVTTIRCTGSPFS